MRNNPEVGQQMFEMIERWQTSGLSQKAFCEQQSIKFHTFYYWYKRYRMQQATEQDTSGSFVKLHVAKPSSASSVEIHFPGGIRLIFHEPVSSSYVKSLIS